MDQVVSSGAVELRPIDDDPGAVDLLRKLSRVSRRRWPGSDGGDTRKRIPVTIA